MNANRACFLIACIVFVLAALSIQVGAIPLLPVGLAFIAAGLLL